MVDSGDERIDPHGVADAGDPPNPSSHGPVREILPAPQGDTPAGPIERSRSGKSNGRIFARSGGGGGLGLNLMSATATVLGVLALAVAVWGLWLLIGWGWGELRPALDERGAPFTRHQCRAGGRVLEGDGLRELGALFLDDRVATTLRARFARAQRISVGGQDAVRFSIEGAGVVAVRDAAAAAGVGTVAIRFQDPVAACTAFRSLGLPEGTYVADADGVVDTPDGVRPALMVSPRRGKVEEIRLLRHSD